MGRDPHCILQQDNLLRFNPRARMGRDVWNAQYQQRPTVSIHAPAWDATGDTVRIREKITVSIHAPAWDATSSVCWIGSFCLFQSTRPHGTRQVYNERIARENRFQSTRPHGTRQRRWRRLSRVFCFNPRARMGRDLNHRQRGEILKVSIHAPAWDATALSHLHLSVVAVSIHAPAWDATGFRVQHWPISVRFQSTRPHGTRPY